MTYKHEPCGSDEIFVGNTEGLTLPDYLRPLTTARLGEQALDFDGDELPRDQYRPIFINRSDHAEHDRIMAARFAAINRSPASA